MIDNSQEVRVERRKKREARRIKQREQNIMRAEKMHQARLADTLLKKPMQKKIISKPQFHVGCSGWFYWHWKGQFYPETLSTSEWFSHYMKQFKTVELNAPFYSWPTVNTVKTWKKQLGKKRFVYTVKVSEFITHVKQAEGTETLVKDFGYIADVLGSHMGCFLFQFPPSFHYSDERFKTILSQLEPHRRNVVEFRHKSWWNDNVFRAFQESGTIFCSSSAPKLPDTLVTTNDEVYVRFHGLTQWYRYDYSKQELADWAKRIYESGAKTVWAYFNNDREGYAIQNAKTFLKQLKHLYNGK